MIATLLLFAYVFWISAFALSEYRTGGVLSSRTSIAAKRGIVGLSALHVDDSAKDFRQRLAFRVSVSLLFALLSPVIIPLIIAALVYRLISGKNLNIGPIFPAYIPHELFNEAVGLGMNVPTRWTVSVTQSVELKINPERERVEAVLGGINQSGFSVECRSAGARIDPVGPQPINIRTRQSIKKWQLNYEKPGRYLVEMAVFATIDEAVTELGSIERSIEVREWSRLSFYASRVFEFIFKALALAASICAFAKFALDLFGIQHPFAR